MLPNDIAQNSAQNETCTPIPYEIPCTNHRFETKAFGHDPDDAIQIGPLHGPKKREALE